MGNSVKKGNICLEFNLKTCFSINLYHTWLWYTSFSSSSSLLHSLSKVYNSLYLLLLFSSLLRSLTLSRFLHTVLGLYHTHPTFDMFSVYFVEPWCPSHIQFVEAATYMCMLIQCVVTKCLLQRFYKILLLCLELREGLYELIWTNHWGYKYN